MVVQLAERMYELIQCNSGMMWVYDLMNGSRCRAYKLMNCTVAQGGGTSRYSVAVAG